MATYSVGQRLMAEFIGTAALVAIVIGSGIMATRLSDDVGVQLLMNAAATVAGLAVLISTLGPVSGAHFNPAVSLLLWRRSELPTNALPGYVGAQVVGATMGALVANVMFGEPVLAWATKERGGLGHYLGEIVATAGLLAIIIASQRFRLKAAMLIPLWIGAAYFFTSSTSFANPAVTFGRMFSDSFAGISPGSVLGFILSQLCATVIVMVALPPSRTTPRSEIHV